MTAVDPLRGRPQGRSQVHVDPTLYRQAQQSKQRHVRYTHKGGGDVQIIESRALHIEVAKTRTRRSTLEKIVELPRDIEERRVEEWCQSAAEVPVVGRSEVNGAEVRWLTQ
jgi:tRNA G37 N-methylase TrmD